MEIGSIIKGGFTEVTGLSMQIEVDSIKVGGVNDHEHKLLKGTKYSDITLKRGLIDYDLWTWFQKTACGDEAIKRENGSISLCDHLGNVVFTWSFFEALPIKWDGPALNAASSTVATESLVPTHHGLLKEKPPKL